MKIDPPRYEARPLPTSFIPCASTDWLSHALRWHNHTHGIFDTFLQEHTGESYPDAEKAEDAAAAKNRAYHRSLVG